MSDGLVVVLPFAILKYVRALILYDPILSARIVRNMSSVNFMVPVHEMSSMNCIILATKLDHFHEILVVHVIRDVAPVNLEWLQTFDELKRLHIF